MGRGRSASSTASRSRSRSQSRERKDRKRHRRKSSSKHHRKHRRKHKKSRHRSYSSSSSRSRSRSRSRDREGGRKDRKHEDTSRSRSRKRRKTRSPERARSRTRSPETNDDDPRSNDRARGRSRSRDRGASGNARAFSRDRRESDGRDRRGDRGGGERGRGPGRGHDERRRDDFRQRGDHRGDHRGAAHEQRRGPSDHHNRGGHRGSTGFGRAADIPRRPGEHSRNPPERLGPNSVGYPGGGARGRSPPRAPREPPRAPGGGGGGGSGGGGGGAGWDKPTVGTSGAAFKATGEEDGANLVYYSAELDGAATPCWAAAADRDAAGDAAGDAASATTNAARWGAYPACTSGLGTEILDFIAYCSPDADELKARYAAVLRLDRLGKRLWGEGAEVECFGSTKHKMPLYYSGIDMRIKTTGKYEHLPECQGITRLGTEIMEQAWATDVDPRVTGRVPMISYVDRATGLKCKVCVGNRQTVRGTSFFNTPMIPLSARFPMFKLLMLPLKCVFTQRGLEKSFGGGLGTFRVGMLLLNYFAMHVPVSTQPPTPETLGAALIGFFRYYAGESPDATCDAHCAPWQRWSANYEAASEFYVLGVQVDFGGCAMGEVQMVLKACANALQAARPNASTRTTILSRLIDDTIIADAREGARRQSRARENALSTEAAAALPASFVPERRTTFVSDAPLPTLPAGGDATGGDAIGGPKGGGPSGAGADVPSTCVNLKNMFDPAHASRDASVVSEVHEDVRLECGNHGVVTHSAVDKNSQGFVYVKFDTVQAATEARRTLNARWFAGRLVTCDFIAEDEYDAVVKSLS